MDAEAKAKRLADEKVLVEELETVMTKSKQSCEEWLGTKEAQGICKLRSDSSTWHHMAPIASAAQDVWSHLICTAISEEHPYKRVSNGSNEDTPTRSQWVKEL